MTSPLFTCSDILSRPYQRFACHLWCYTCWPLVGQREHGSRITSKVLPISTVSLSMLSKQKEHRENFTAIGCKLQNPEPDCAKAIILLKELGSCIYPKLTCVYCSCWLSVNIDLFIESLGRSHREILT